MSEPFTPGQRWISDTEPELGLGSLETANRLSVVIRFPASGERREYARDNAPIRRVRFHPGDHVKSRDGRPFEIAAVEEHAGLLVYRNGSGAELSETALLDAISFDKPEERLFAGQIDPPSLFDLRIDALRHQHDRRASPVRGFVGGRIDLLPHQLYIAAETTSRLIPRVLLADEVGLGKTIEACLILHRLILTGRARRVLIVTPDSLVHQWLVEMLRRFSLWFHIYDEPRCASIEASHPGANPFLEDQLVLASLRLFAGREERTRQAAESGFDVVVVDEAHHLGWSPEAASPEYRAVEILGRAAPSLLLLTGTPEQLGLSSHFARLRLLDPARFHSLDAFVAESERYVEVARATETTTSPEGLSRLLDRHGTGRVMFRNTRHTIAGFPRREVRLDPLPRVALDPSTLAALANPEDDGGRDPADLSHDPRVEWLIERLRELRKRKVLLIAHRRETVEALEEAIRTRYNLRMAVFHEGLSMVQRDRHAAWFAEEDGARLLLCSEIGSEGRNFQFAHHLVLFDLPLEPELLEQRIGRLDRIGQKHRITLHIPYIKGSAQEVLARWYHEGLDAFRANLHGGHALRELFSERLADVARRAHTLQDDETAEAIDALVRETAAARATLTARLEAGRDRLLELNSYRQGPAEAIVEEVRSRDADLRLDAFMNAVFDLYTIPVEELAPRTYRLGSSGVLEDTFPGLPMTGLTVTCDRARALVREDIQFLTWDHPLVTAALDLLLGTGRGNSAYAWWPDVRVNAIYLETVHVIECVAPSALHVDRFLAPKPLRQVLARDGEDVSGEMDHLRLRALLQRGDASLLEVPEIREDLLPRLIRLSTERARAEVPAVVAKARETMTTQLDAELARLRALREVNPSVRPEEIDALRQQRRDLDASLQQARVRLDAIRVIRRGSDIAR